MATQDQLKSNLECPICLNLLDKPKILSCSHAFCKQCLTTLYTAQTERDCVCCPLCRQTTDVPGGDVSKLATNLAVQSLIDDLAAKVYYCTTCDDKTSAITFCADCDDYMCDSCKQNHDKWKKFSSHEQFSMEEVNAGKPGTKKKEKCKRHGKENKDMWCLYCKTYICPRCRMVDHSKHDVIEAEDHERGHNEKIADLMARVQPKKTRFAQHATFIKEQQMNAQAALQEPIKQIEAVRDEAMRRIKERSNLLISHCKKHEQLMTSKLDGLVGENDMQTACIKSAGELVKNGMRGRLDGDALVAHNTLCEELKKLLEGCKVDFLKIDNLSRHAAGLVFKPKGDPKNIEIGFLRHVEFWAPGQEKAVAQCNTPVMAATPDGRMAVGRDSGGILIYSADGLLQQTVLDKEKWNSGLGYLSDGRCVVRNLLHSVSLYTIEGEKLDLKFETLNWNESGLGNLTVDSDDQIYVSYAKANKIQVFTPAGGKAVREIPCVGYAPWQIFAMKASKKLLASDSFNSVIVMDESGNKKHEVLKDRDTYQAWPCVSQNGSILIAWVKYEEGLVSIDRYTDELQHIQTLITDHKIEMTKRRCYLQEFPTGEIALRTTDMLYIFHQSIVPADLYSALP